MKYISNRYSVFAGFLLFVLTGGVYVYATTNPSVTATSPILIAFEPQPSVQSSGLPIDVLGIPTGNNATVSPQPDIDLNRCGPGIVLGFGQVVYDQTDIEIQGLDEVTNLVIARRHLSRKNQTKTIRNEVYGSGDSLVVGEEYQWVDTSGSPNLSNVGAGNAGTYSPGDTFTATSAQSPTSWGTAKVQLANDTIDKHSPFGPSWAFNYNHTITRYGDDVIMESYGRRDYFTPAPLANVTTETSPSKTKRVTITSDPVSGQKWTIRLDGKTLTHTVSAATKTAVAGALSTLINNESGYTTSFTSNNDYFTVTYTASSIDVSVVAENLWEGSRGRFGRLTYNASSAMYNLRMPHGTRLEFTADNSAAGKPAHLTKIISPNDTLDSTADTVTLAFTYETSSEQSAILKRKLKSITDSFGRVLNFNYASSSEYVTSIVEQSTSRTFTYTYDTDGQLLSMTSPAVSTPGNINNFSNGKKYEYQYLDSTDATLKYLLKAVIFPNQVADSSKTPRYAWTYDQSSQSTGNSVNPNFGYVKSFTFGEGTFTYIYQALASFIGASSNKAVRQIEVTDREGTKTIYKTNPFGQVLLEDIKTRGLRTGVTGSYAKSFKYNEDGQLTQYDNPIGARTQYAYTNRRDLADTTNNTFPNATNPRNVEYPMTDTIYLPAPTKANTSDQSVYIRHRTVYEPIYNQPFKIVDSRGLVVPAQGTTQTEINTLREKYTTTNYYDYMEGLANSKATLAGLMGIAESALEPLLQKSGVIGSNSIVGNTYPTTTNNLNEDGKTNQIAGNLIKTELPAVTLPNQSEFSQVKNDLGITVTSTAPEIFQYNNYGQKTYYKDARNNGTTYSYYDKNGSASSGGGGYLNEVVEDAVAGGDSTSPIAQTTTYKYASNSRGVPTSIIDPLGVETTYTLNELDQVVSEVRAANKDARTNSPVASFAYETLTLYDGNNNIIETRVENADTLIDASGSANSTVITNNGGWIVTKSTFDILDQPKSVIEDDGDGSNGEISIETTYTYDKNQNLVEKTFGDSTTSTHDEYAKETTSYDERDLMISLTVGVGEEEEATYEQVVDAVGNVIKYFDGEAVNANTSNSVVVGDVIEIIYDGYNRQQKVIDRVGNYKTYNYDSASNVISEKSYGNLDALSTSKVLLSQINTDYDERNRATDIDRALFLYSGKEIGAIRDVDSAANDGFASKSILYDGLDREVAVLDEEKGLKAIKYDGLSRVDIEIDEDGNSIEFTYDKNGNVTEIRETEVESIADLNGELYITEMVYDALNRMTQITEPYDQSNTSTKQTTNYKYDSRDNTIEIKDANDNVTELTYDRLNRLVQKDVFLSNTGTGANRNSVTNPVQSGDGKITTRYIWDKLNRILSEIDDKGNSVDSTYDDLNRKTEVKYVDNSVEKWTYNDDNDPIEYIDRNGTKVSKTFDAESRPIAETFVSDANSLERDGSTNRTWKYDGIGRLVQTFDNNDPNDPTDDVTCFYVYDSLSRRIRETQRIGTDTSSDLNVDTTWEGASNNRKIESIYPNGLTITRNFDKSDRLIFVGEKTNGGTDFIASYDYKGPDRTIGASYGNDAVLTTTFDYNRRAVETKWEKDSYVIVHYKNTFNKTNRPLSENRLHLGDGNYDDYTYDAAYRMTKFLQNATLNDNTNAVTGGTESNRTLDGANMMTAFNSKGSNVVLSSNNLNQYTTFNNKLRNHDNNGNVDDFNTNDSTDADDQEFVQDHKNRIAKVRNGNSSATVAKYAYTADGRIALKTANSITIRYIYDGSEVIEEREFSSNNTVLRQYVAGQKSDKSILMKDYTVNSNTPDDYYFHSNAAGSVGALTDNEGYVAEYYTYDWFGKKNVYEGFGAAEVDDYDIIEQLELTEADF